MQSIHLETRRRNLNCSLRQIYPVTLGPGTSPLEMVGAHAHPDLEHLLSRVPRELRDGMNERLDRIPVLLNSLKPLATQLGHIADQFPACSTRVSLPVVTDDFIGQFIAAGRRSQLVGRHIR